MSYIKPSLLEQHVDEIVAVQAEDGSAWDKPIRVSRSKSVSSGEEDMAYQENAYKTLEAWARASNLNLTMVFTDIVASTRIGVELGDKVWIENLFVHFSRARALASKYDCYVVKSIGDAFMVAFRSAPEAILFALEFAMDTGVDYIGIRVGINSGHVQIRENDIYGLNVNFTSRVQHTIKTEGIMVSDVDKKDFEKAFGRRVGDYCWFLQKDIAFEEFGSRTLWWVMSRPLREAMLKQRIARRRLLGVTTPHSNKQSK